MLRYDFEQGSDEWMKARSGIPTASEFGNLVTGTGVLSRSVEDFAKTLACEKYHQGPVDEFHGNKWTEAGNEDEAAAREWYGFTTGYDVSQVGFVTDDERTCGCSPDAEVGEGGLLELKRLKGSKLVDMALYLNKHKKLAPQYIPQTQGQMMICERAWCDVVFYNPATPCLKIRVYPDADFAMKLRSQIKVVNKMRDDYLSDLEW